MRFGGHQTFTIRDGWLYKGLESLLGEEEQRLSLVSDEAHDILGVGKNMAKSIQHWLLATGLAVKNTNNGKQQKDLVATPFAQTVNKHDPYLVDSFSWWVVHLYLVNTPEHAATWDWFFNRFTPQKFQKALALQGLLRQESIESKRPVSQTTLERDLACFLGTYSVEVPSKKKDPEDDIDSPLKELGLITYFRNTDNYQINSNRKEINPYVLMVALSFLDVEEVNGWCEVSFFDLVRLPNNPGRVFFLNNEMLFEELLSLESTKGFSKYFKLEGLAGERVLKFKKLSATDWLKKYYESRGE